MLLQQPLGWLNARLLSRAFWNWSRTSRRCVSRSIVHEANQPDQSGPSSMPHKCTEYMDGTSIGCGPEPSENSGCNGHKETGGCRCGQEQHASTDAPDAAAPAKEEAEMRHSGSADDQMRPANPLTDLKRPRKTRETVRRSSTRSVWSAALLTPVLLGLAVLAAFWLNPIQGVEAGTRALDRHLRDTAGKTPALTPDKTGSEYQ